MAGLNKGKQTHIEVPSSNEPLPAEWGKPMWYVIRLSALQASADLSDEKARQLVSFFDALHVTIPCPECRGHFAEYYATKPFTVDMAKDTKAAMWWVEEYRRTVDERIARERETSAAAPVINAHISDPKSGVRNYAIRSAVQVTQMNHTGRKIGCNCSGKRNKRRL